MQAELDSCKRRTIEKRNKMDTIITIIIIVAAVLLIGIVLIQNSKGGGLDSSFGNVNQLGGSARSTETIEKMTWTLAGSIGVLSLIAAMFFNPIPGGGEQKGSSIQNKANTTVPASQPTPGQ